MEGDAGHQRGVDHLHVLAEASQESEERFRLMVEGVKDYAIFMLDPEGRVSSWNAGAERIKGYRAGEIIGRHFSAFYLPEDIQRGHPEEELRIAKERGQYEEEGLRVRKDGSRFWASVLITALWDDSGELRGFSKVTRDITERRRAEEALRRSEERFRATFEQAAVGIAHVATDGTFIRVNDKLCHITGYPQEDLLEKTFQEITHPEDLDADVEQARQLLAGEIDTYSIEKRYLRKDGEAVWVNLTGSLVRGPSKDPEYFIAVVEDISERKWAEEALGEIREAERRRMARDLHDEVLQDLMDTLYSMQATRLRVRAQGIDVPEMDREIDNLLKATHGLREAIGDLRRGSIWQWPFLYTLRSVVTANRQKAPQIEIDLDTDVSFSSEPPGRAGVELLRIIQEALVNVRRHSQARHVRVSLWEKRGFLAAEVVDDGRGFDSDTAWNGVGLSAMQERVSEVGGDLDIQSVPGKGTKVLVRIPTALALAAGASTVPSKTRGGC